MKYQYSIRQTIVNLHNIININLSLCDQNNNYLYFKWSLALTNIMQTHSNTMKRQCCLLSLFQFFLICFFFSPQFHISHYYVRSVFPHCSSSQLHERSNLRPLLCPLSAHPGHLIQGFPTAIPAFSVSP